MDSLPPTSYVRMVDIWLIVCQVIPFLEVIILTTKEYYFDQEIINHHGRARDVWENEEEKDTKMYIINFLARAGKS